MKRAALFRDLLADLPLPERVALGGCVLLLAITLALVGRRAYVSNRCMELGYREGRIGWTLKGFCLTRVNQTDRVVPLEVAAGVGE